MTCEEYNYPTLNAGFEPVPEQGGTALQLVSVPLPGALNGERHGELFMGGTANFGAPDIPGTHLIAVVSGNASSVRVQSNRSNAVVNVNATRNGIVELRAVYGSNKSDPLGPSNPLPLLCI